MQLNSFSVILAQAPPAAPAAAPQSSFFGSQIVMMGLIAVIFYFMLIRPQQKRAKEQRKMIEALKSGDKVITSAGIVGTVTSVRDTSVSLRSADAKMEVTKASVVQILDASTPTES